MDVRREAVEHHDLSDAGAGDAFPAGAWRVRTPILPLSNAPRPERDSDRLFAQIHAPPAVVGGQEDNAEPDLRHGTPERTEGSAGSPRPRVTVPTGHGTLACQWGRIFETATASSRSRLPVQEPRTISMLTVVQCVLS